MAGYIPSPTAFNPSTAYYHSVPMAYSTSGYNYHSVPMTYSTYGYNFSQPLPATTSYYHQPSDILPFSYPISAPTYSHQPLLPPSYVPLAPNLATHIDEWWAACIDFRVAFANYKSKLQASSGSPTDPDTTLPLHSPTLPDAHLGLSFSSDSPSATSPLDGDQTHEPISTTTTAKSTSVTGTNPTLEAQIANPEAPTPNPHSIATLSSVKSPLQSMDPLIHARPPLPLSATTTPITATSRKETVLKVVARSPPSVMESKAAIVVGADLSPQLVACTAAAYFTLHQLKDAKFCLSNIPKLEGSPSSCSQTKFYGMVGEAYVPFVSVQVVQFQKDVSDFVLGFCCNLNWLHFFDPGGSSSQVHFDFYIKTKPLVDGCDVTNLGAFLKSPLADVIKVNSIPQENLTKKQSCRDHNRYDPMNYFVLDFWDNSALFVRSSIVSLYINYGLPNHVQKVLDEIAHTVVNYWRRMHVFYPGGSSTLFVIKALNPCLHSMGIEISGSYDNQGLVFCSIILIFRVALSKFFISDSEVIEVVSSLTPLLATSVSLNGIQPIMTVVAIGSDWQAVVAYVDVSNGGCSI